MLPLHGTCAVDLQVSKYILNYYYYYYYYYYYTR
jgi:hypothetical protein